MRQIIAPLNSIIELEKMTRKRARHGRLKWATRMGQKRSLQVLHKSSTIAEGSEHGSSRRRGAPGTRRHVSAGRRLCRHVFRRQSCPSGVSYTARYTRNTQQTTPDDRAEVPHCAPRTPYWTCLECMAGGRNESIVKHRDRTYHTIIPSRQDTSSRGESIGTDRRGIPNRADRSRALVGPLFRDLICLSRSSPRDVSVISVSPPISV